jgi:2'-5' RNA ligase
VGELLRVFIGLPVGAPGAGLVEGWAGEHARGWRAVPAANLHLTAVFLGATPAGEVDAVAVAMAEELADVPAVSMRPAQARRFGSVLALPLVSDDREALELLAAAQGRLAARLDRVERRAWTPHVTVGRARRGERPPVPEALPPPLDLLLDEAVLYRSQPGPGGVTYRALATVSLKRIGVRTDADVSRESPAARVPHGRDRGRRGDPDIRRRREEGDP